MAEVGFLLAGAGGVEVGGEVGLSYFWAKGRWNSSKLSLGWGWDLRRLSQLYPNHLLGHYIRLRGLLPDDLSNPIVLVGVLLGIRGKYFITARKL